MENPNVALEVLLQAGISESVAVSMLKAMEPKPKTKKKKYYGTSTKREKINVPVVVVQTCVTCKCATSHKTVMQVYSDVADIEQHCIVGQCQNCIKMYELMDKDELISLLIIMNHSDVEIRGMSTASQIKMAEKKTALEWLTLKMNHVIAYGDKDKEGFVDMPGINLNRK